MAKEALSGFDIFRRLVVLGCRSCAEIVALDVKIVLGEEPLQPHSLPRGWIGSGASFEHDVVFGCVDVSLVSQNSFVYFIVDENGSLTRLFGLQMDNSEALPVRSELSNVAESQPNDILNAQSCLIK